MTPLLLASLIALLRDRAEAHEQIRTDSGGGAHEAAVAPRRARQTHAWRTDLHKRWRAVVASTRSDHYEQTARFMLAHERPPEEAEPHLVRVWLRRLEESHGVEAPKSWRPFAPREVA